MLANMLLAVSLQSLTSLGLKNGVEEAQAQECLVLNLCAQRSFND